MSGVGAERESAKFDLSLGLAATAHGLRGGLAYATDLFERGTIERMVRHLERVLEQVAADVDVPLSRLDLLGEAERARMLEEWSRTGAEYPADRCIHELFEAQAARTPGTVAVRFEEESLRYGDLNARANQLAHHLRRRGVGPEVRVGICLERSLEMVVAILAVLKAGGAYVPLDPAYPADRLAFILADSATPVLLTRESLRSTLPAVDGVEIISLDGAADQIATESAENPESGARPDTLAYVIYTSGSTGAPKGALIEHRNVARLFSATDAWFGFGPDDVWTLFHSYAFDFSVWELWGALLYGGRVVVVPADVSRDPEAFHALVRREGVTVLNQTPSAFRQFIRVDGERGGDLALRYVVFGGEALEPASLRDWVERRGIDTPRLVNMYGITETTVHVTYRPLGREDVFGGSGSPIGRAIPDLRLYVLDPARRLVPVGVLGELYVGGAGVARGYLNRPELTAERFVDDPFAPGRLYRTGDRVRWMADGTLEYLGRLDEQVKIRGFRIELGEIEAALRQAPGVRDCTVVVREEETGDRRLVAYVVGDAGAVEAEGLREHVRRSLPEYMVPAAFVMLEALPLTANGKLDRKALPAPEFASAEDRYVAPRTPVEEVLAGIWEEVLGLERVGVEESFFDLGGHSLLATRVVSRIREVFAIELPLRALFEGPTVAQLANAVEEMRRAELPVLPPVVPVARTGALPLSFAQERLWFLDRLEPGSTAYNVLVARRLGGVLDRAALERSLGEIVRRHEALRTVFAEADGAPLQVIAPFGGFALPVEDLSALGEADREAAVRRRAGEEAARPFDLAAGPLFRAALLRLGEEDHVLLLSMHHVVSDGWSMGVLFRELSALYAAYREGGESPLPELAVQYADYAVWQREQLEGEVLDRQLAYWRERLSGAPELLELPTDHPRPAVQTYRGASVPVEFAPELLERLQALGRSEGATLYMTLLSAFQVLLSKYAGSEDVVVGSPIAGRTRGEVEALIGFFVNTLVLRADLSGDPSFRDALRRVREATLGAYAHQEVPFERLVSELQPDRSLSHSPLFQVMFALQNAGGGGGALPGLRVSGAGAAMEIAKFDLSLALTATALGLRGGLNYSTDLFEPGTVERMVRHLARVLEQVAADPDVRLSRLALAGPEERARVVVEWNRTGRPFPEGCIHPLFEAQVRRTPNAAALVWGEESLTYRELDARANRLANHLVRLGVGPESRVGLRLERSVENVVATLAVLKAGGCCVPVDTSYPAERMELMLADSGARVLLSRGELVPAEAGRSLRVVSLDQVADALESESVEAPDGGASAGNLAYVFYTSGSTGRPKGVMMTHREVVQYADGLPGTMPIGPGDRVAQASNASFDAAVFEIWGALVHGATLVGIDRDVLLSAPLLGRALREQGITHLYQTAALFNQHVREQVDVYAGLRQLVFGAEAVGTESVRRMLREGKPARVLHEYGPTEATVWCTLEEVDEVAEDAPTVLIGRPIPNARGYVLDPAGEPLPVGVPGELCIGGDGVVRGYLGRPGLTAEKFVPDPFAARPGGRMYRTGDRARWRAEGKLEFMGRLDDQVKIRGFRIEPGEVEAAMAAYPGVREARVMMREDRPGDKRLVAYVVGTMDTEGLRAHLRQGLPEYMVPRAIVTLGRLPLNANGKVDRKALPVPEYGAAEETYVAPRTPAEEVLAGIWAEVLRLERVGVEESFFDLGGHSLLATRVVSRIREVFEVEVPLRALFEGPTVAELGGRVEEIRRAELPMLPPVVPVDRTGPLPLSFAQERLWFIHRLEPGSAAYNIPVVRRLGGALDRGALERALGEIVRRHEALRTVFAEVDGTPVQVVAPFRGFALPVQDLSGWSEADREAEVRRRAGEEAGRAFDLSAGPLFRAALLRLGQEDHVLLLSMHHVVSDGWSLGVLFRELSVLYQAYRDGGESPLPELPVQYGDHAVWQRRQLRGEALERQVAWWKERLAGAPELLELPTDHPRPAVQAYRGALEPIRVGPELLERLQALGRGEGATLFMVLTGAFQVLLSRYGGSEDVVVGTTIAGRTRGELEGLIGLFMNTLVLRTDLSGQPTFRQVLRRVREMTLGAYEHQELPFERLVEELRPERSLGHSPLIQVLIELLAHDGQGGGGGLAGVETRGLGAEVKTAKFDLAVAMAATPHGLAGGVTYNTDLFERGTVRALVEHLVRVLEQVSAHPDQPVSRLRLMSGAERDLVAGWNRTAAGYPAERCIHQWLEMQAARTPHAPAVRFGEEGMTFGELDARANRVARHLAGLGVGVETRVGVCLERGLDMMPALLGVMKAGGAYVPIDPSHPAERMSYVMEDSGMRVLLTQAGLRGRVPAAGGVAVVCLDGERARIEAQSAAPLETGVTSENLCYVIYTSGSTGRPKGVAMHHRGVSNYVHWGIRHYGADAGSGAPVFSSMAVDLTITNLLPLFCGHPVHFLPEENAVEALADAIRRKPGYGLIKITPTHLALLNDLLAPEELRGSTKTLVVGADFLTAEPTVPWQEHAPDVRLMNEYGPTETVVGCSAYTLPNGVHRAGPVPVGGAIQNLAFHVLDGGMEPVPVGLPGELYIGGAGVARGYLGRPALSAEKFVPDPFAEPGARMYRTGDRARWLPDGNLMILGRGDNQVKIRGYRVELGEVEAALRAHPAVSAALAVMREDVPGDRRLVAYVVGDATAADPSALREHMLASVPEYMVPSAFVRLDALPRTTTGKLSPRMLPPPVYAAAADAVAPRNDVERQVAEVWKSVLSLPELGVYDNFFDVGGTSLLLYRVFSRLREIRPDLRLVELFRYTTVESLAAHMAAETQQDAEFLSHSRSRGAERRAARRPGRGS